MDQRTRKLKTIRKAVHRRDDIERLYASRKEGEWKLARKEYCVDAVIQNLEKNTKQIKQVNINLAVSNCDASIIKKKSAKTRKQKYEEQQLYK